MYRAAFFSRTSPGEAIHSRWWSFVGLILFSTRRHLMSSSVYMRQTLDELCNAQSASLCYTLTPSCLYNVCFVTITMPSKDYRLSFIIALVLLYRVVEYLTHVWLLPVSDSLCSLSKKGALTPSRVYPSFA